MVSNPNWSRTYAMRVSIFDFDGTIVDTLDSLVGIPNDLADDFGYAPIINIELAYLRNLSSRQIIKYSGIPLFQFRFHFFE